MKFQRVQRIGFCDKREFDTVLVRDGVATIDSYDFGVIYRNIRELANGRKLTHGLMSAVNGRLFIHHDEWLKGQKEHFTIFLDGMVIDEDAPPLPPNRSEIIS